LISFLIENQISIEKNSAYEQERELMNISRELLLSFGRTKEKVKVSW
jgi:hypothetical protein